MFLDGNILAGTSNFVSVREIFLVKVTVSVSVVRVSTIGVGISVGGVRVGTIVVSVVVLSIGISLTFSFTLGNGVVDIGISVSHVWSGVSVSLGDRVGGIGSAVHQGVGISVRGSVSSIGVKQLGIRFSISFSLTLVDQVVSTINVGGGVSGVSNGVSVSGDWGSNMVGCGNGVSDRLSHNRLGVSDYRGLVRDNLGGFNLNGFDNGGNGFDQGLVPM